MRKLIYLLMTMPLFIASCSNEDMAITEETVEVNFCAELPQRMGTRATSTLSVDKVYCAVFENDTEITTLREVITIENGSDIVFSPRLIKGRTYDVVFWAAKEGSYNVEDMTSITRNSNANVDEENFDAFTAHTSVTVNNSTQTTPITLTRPLAQLNMGVTQEDWNGVAHINDTIWAMTVAMAAPAMPMAGRPNQPKINTGSRRMFVMAPVAWVIILSTVRPVAWSRRSL